MRGSASWILGAAITALSACGGKVVVDGTGGANGTGGTGGTTSSSSTSTTSTSTSTTSSSSSSSSSTSSSSTGGPACPDPFPGIFAKCPVEGQECAAPLACCAGSAVCKGGFWQFIGPLCGQPCAPECGPDGFACEVGAVCVTYIGPVTTYQCRVNPCFEGLDCNCAGPYCAEQMMTCNNIQGGFKVLCD